MLGAQRRALLIVRSSAHGRLVAKDLALELGVTEDRARPGRSTLPNRLPPRHAASMTTSAAGTARSFAPLSTAWFATALSVGPVGFLLFSLSEGSGARQLSVMLCVAALLAGAAGAAVLTIGEAVRSWSLALSGGCVVLGLVAAGTVLSSTTTFLADVALLGLPPLVGGVITGLLALRR